MSRVVAVTDVLEQKELALHPVHIPRPTVDIRWVATSELPDPAPFFEGGEVLLTTGLQTTEWRNEWQQYVDSLVDAGTVAIGMATGLTYTRSPDELVAACRQAGLNLFEVPRRTPFVAVSHTISRLLAEEEEAGAREALAVQRKLTAAAAKPNPARTVSQVLADALGGATAVLTTDGRVQLEPIGRRSGELDLSELASELRRMHLRGSRSAATVTNPQGTTLLQPIGVSRPRSRVLVALGPPRLTEAQRSAVTTAVALLSLIAEQQQHSAATYRRLRRRAVDLLVTGDGHTAELLLQTEPTPRALPTSLRLVLASGPGPQIEDIVTALEDRYIVVAESDTQLCVVAPNTRAAEIASYLAQAGMRVGTGSAVDAEHASESYRTAGLALAQASPTTPVVEWEHILRQGPLGLIDTANAQRFAASFLGSLDPEQVETLRCFLRHHGSRLKVAEELGLHRNTVRNRLEAIGAALPGSLDDPQIRASAWIALQVTP